MSQEQWGWYQASDGGWYQSAVSPAKGWVLCSDSVWRPAGQASVQASAEPVPATPSERDLGLAMPAPAGASFAGTNVAVGVIGIVLVAFGLIGALSLMAMPTSYLCGSPLSSYASAGSESANFLDGICVRQANQRLLLAVVPGGIACLLGLALVAVGFGGDQLQKFKAAASAGTGPPR